MQGMVVWLISSFVICGVLIGAANFIEATVHNYRLRLLAMFLAGLVIGAVSSAVGYAFFIITILLVFNMMHVKQKVAASTNNRGLALKYIIPTLVLIFSATICSYVFAIEKCTGEQSTMTCKRVFFDRIYIPPPSY
jgi:hypothetical protein